MARSAAARECEDGGRGAAPLSLHRPVARRSDRVRRRPARAPPADPRAASRTGLHGDRGAIGPGHERAQRGEHGSGRVRERHAGLPGRDAQPRTARDDAGGDRARRARRDRSARAEGGHLRRAEGVVGHLGAVHQHRDGLAGQLQRDRCHGEHPAHTGDHVAGGAQQPVQRDGLGQRRHRLRERFDVDDLRRPGFELAVGVRESAAIDPDHPSRLLARAAVAQDDDLDHDDRGHVRGGDTKDREPEQHGSDADRLLQHDAQMVRRVVPVRAAHDVRHHRPRTGRHAPRAVRAHRRSAEAARADLHLPVHAQRYHDRAAFRGERTPLPRARGQVLRRRAAAAGTEHELLLERGIQPQQCGAEADHVPRAGRLLDHSGGVQHATRGAEPVDGQHRRRQHQCPARPADSAQLRPLPGWPVPLAPVRRSIDNAVLHRRQRHTCRHLLVHRGVRADRHGDGAMAEHGVDRDIPGGAGPVRRTAERDQCSGQGPPGRRWDRTLSRVRSKRRNAGTAASSLRV